jgi:asparagine synthase (glutamine-hydrolysing)
MCGIICIFKRLSDAVKPLSHRGPDEFHEVILGQCIMKFYRLAINGLGKIGQQPFYTDHSALVCNGEIFFPKHTMGTSDCECLIPLIENIGIEGTCDIIRGEFAFCYTDGESVSAARDPFGVRPLFFTETDAGMIFTSEIKAQSNLDNIKIFPPGHYYHKGTLVCYYHYMWKEVPQDIFTNIRLSFEKAVRIRVQNTEKNIGFLLSGGLDSSLVVAVAKKFLPGKLKTFSIGTSVDSPDIKAARIVSKYLDTDHTEVIFTLNEGIAVLSNVIYSLESYDTTTVRASVPMWLLAQWISKNTDCKVILSGEGSDELFGGYLYFHNAPSTQDFTDECARRLKLIHQFDGLRADRCIAAHGLELRVPFLDVDFVNVGMTINQDSKRTILEKNVLRTSFVGILPDEILYRQKNGMSDAVGYNWVDRLKDYAYECDDAQFSQTREDAHGHCEPQSFEEALYRRIFWEHFGHCDYLISEIWRPKWTTVTDPSARCLEQFKD